MESVRNPADIAETVASFRASAKQDADEAIEAAAFQSWRDTPAVQRCRTLFKCKALLEERFLELSRLLVKENGKTLPEAKGDLRCGHCLREHFCPEAFRALPGNGASVLDHVSLDMKVAKEEIFGPVLCGMLGVNVGVPAPMAFFSFGGRKSSFFGDLRAQGRDAVEFYTQKKSVIERWPGGAAGSIWAS